MEKKLHNDDCKQRFPSILRVQQLITCQPIPRLRTEGGTGVALAYLDTAMKEPVDCPKNKSKR